MKLLRMPEAIKREINQILKTQAEKITRLQKRLAPRSSGDLQNSIGYTFGVYKAANANVRGLSVGETSLAQADARLSVTIHAGDEKAYYAKWIEFGIAGPWTIGGRVEGQRLQHPGFTGQPYFYPAYRAYAKPTKAALRSAIRRGIKQAVGK